MSYGPGWKLHKAQQAAKRARTATETRLPRRKLPPPDASPAAPAAALPADPVAQALARIEARLDREAEARATLAGTLARLEERLLAAATESAARIATQLAELARAQAAAAGLIHEALAAAARQAEGLQRRLAEAAEVQGDNLVRLGSLLAELLERTPKAGGTIERLERLAADTAELLRRIPAASNHPEIPDGSPVDHVPDAGNIVDAKPPAPLRAPAPRETHAALAASAAAPGAGRWALRRRERTPDRGWRWTDRWWNGEVSPIGQPRTTTAPASLPVLARFADEAEADLHRTTSGTDFGHFRPCPLPDEVP